MKSRAQRQGKGSRRLLASTCVLTAGGHTSRLLNLDVNQCQEQALGWRVCRGVRQRERASARRAKALKTTEEMSPETPLKSVFEEPPPARSSSTRSRRGQTYLPHFIPQSRGKRKRGQERNEHNRRTDPFPEVRKPKSFTRSSPCHARLLASVPLLNRGQTNVLFWQKKLSSQWHQLCTLIEGPGPLSMVLEVSVYHPPCTNPMLCTPGYRRLDVPLPAEEGVPGRASHHGHPRRLPALPPSSGKEPFSGRLSKVRREGSDSFPSLRIPFDRAVKPHGRQDIQLKKQPPRSFDRSRSLQIKALA